jgi:hypothetical protein
MRVWSLFLTGSFWASVAAGDTLVPLCQGLSIVTAVAQPQGDYESIKTVESVGASEIRVRYSSESMFSDLFSAAPPQLKKTLLFRNMLKTDLESGTFYQQSFFEKSAETIPGSTSIGTSTAVLTRLRKGMESDLSISNAYGGLELGADRNKFPSYYHYSQGGKIHKAATVRVPVLLNDKLVQMPAIQAQGDLVGDKVEFLFLDDENNPLTLAFRLGIGAKNGKDRDTLRVINITHHCAALLASGSGGAGILEQSLAGSGKADVYSIYFSFNSDAIREESEPALKDIAEVLHRHPDWKLRVGGHTDAVGGDQYNLELSSKRAAAVKDALVKRYGIDARRLSASGFGKTQPKDSNETLEGRARNRRVELVKQ